MDLFTQVEQFATLQGGGGGGGVPGASSNLLKRLQVSHITVIVLIEHKLVPMQI